MLLTPKSLLIPCRSLKRPCRSTFVRIHGGKLKTHLGNPLADVGEPVLPNDPMRMLNPACKNPSSAAWLGQSPEPFKGSTGPLRDRQGTGVVQILAFFVFFFS